MKEDWEQDALWDLLGKSRPVSVSPFFSRNIVREIRRSSAKPWLSPIVLRWVGAGAFAVILAGFFTNLSDSAKHTMGSLSGNVEISQMIDAAAGLDSLVAVKEVSLSDYTADL